MPIRLACALSAVLALGLLAGAAAAQTTPKTEEEKTVYALGLAVARNLAVFDLSPEEIQLVIAGLQAGLGKGATAVDLTAYQEKIDPLAQERATRRAKREREASTAFVAAAAKEKGAKKEASGLVYRETKAGAGDHPGPDDLVRVHYIGKLRDGRVFDSSRERGEPTEFPLPRMVPCWREGLMLMKPGGAAVITCPADLAYGDTGVPPGVGDRIPPGAALQFDVELLSVEKGKGAVPPPPPAP